MAEMAEVDDSNITATIEVRFLDFLGATYLHTGVFVDRLSCANPFIF